MNISVRVLSANAQAQIKALQAQVAGLQKQLASANAVSAAPNGIGSAKSRKSMSSWGNQIQWTGRQLQYNWTIPLLLAGGAATKFALDNEKAFTRVKKVYGDADAAAAWYRKNQDQIPEGMNATEAAAASLESELGALEEAFAALSSRYGVNQKEVLETAGAWAAAGSSGVALAKSTKISLKAAVLGDMELAKATEALIGIQAQYSLSTKELNFTLAELNAIENQTGISMKGLIEGFYRSAGVAREFGVDVRHLGAMLAALVPATGTAANAGNSLKTIITRLMNPTKDARDIMEEFGVSVSEAAWKNSTAMDRLQIVADKMNGTFRETGNATKDAADDMYAISDSQRAIVASVLGSNWQVNRFLVLMRELGPEASYYEKALSATADRAKVFALASEELNAVLESSPKRLEMVWATMQNGLATAIQPLIPYIIYLANEISQLVTRFNELDPSTQKLILMFAVLLALVGPVTKYLGSLMTLIATMAVPLKFLAAGWAVLTTKMVTTDGVTTRVKRSFTGMIATMLKTPWKYMMIGFGALIGAIGATIKAIAGMAIVGRATSAAVMAVQIAWIVGIAAIQIAWRGLWLAMVAIQAGGVAKMVALWAAGQVAMVASSAGMVARIGALFASLRGLSLGLAVGFNVGMKLLLGYSFVAYQSIAYGWGAMWGAMRTLMIAGQGALLSAMLTFRLVFLSGWAGMYLAMTAIPAKVYPVLVRMHAAFSAGMTAVTVAMSRAMTVIWAGMHIPMAAISATFWKQVLRIWFVAAMALPKLLVNVRKALQTVWATIVALQRTGALAAAAAAAGPWVALAAAVIAAIILLRDQIRQVWNNTVAYFADSNNQMTQMVLRAWNALPQGVANALTAVARIVRDAALQIYEWFSYINPFARHSPSLVENVTAGTEVISAKFAGMKGSIKGHIAGAYADIKAFGNAIKKLTGGASSLEAKEDRKKIKKVAPGALKEYDQLQRRLKTLQGDLAKLDGAITKQEGVVRRYAKALEEANDKLDKQQAKLDRLIEKQQKWQDKLAEAEGRLTYFASAPIAGMGAMEDKIFDNEMAQKRLRLEMMKMEEATGPLDSIVDRIGAISGMQELLRGEQANLRAAGAGSEILSVYDNEITALEAQKEAQNESIKVMDDMQKALAELERQATMLDLEKSLQFDPLTRQIEKAANAMEELPFDVIMAGVQQAQKDIDKYEEKLELATAAVEKQQGVVDAATAARDRASAALDREEEKLARLRDSYSEVAEAISAVEEALNSALSAADAMARAEEAKKKKKEKDPYVSPALQNFRDAAGGNFAKVGGDGIPVRTNWKDQTAQIEKFTQDMADQAAKAFEDLNPFTGIKEKWGDFKAWFLDKWGVAKSAVKDMFSNIFDGSGGGGGITKITDKFKTTWATTKDWFDKEVLDPLRAVWDLFWPSIEETAKNAWKEVKKAFEGISPEVQGVWKEIKELGPAVEGLWNFMKPIVGIIGGIVAVLIKLVLNVLAKTIGPAFDMIGGIIENVVQIVKGVIQVVSGFFTMFTAGGFTDGLSKMAAGIMNIFGGLIGGIWAIIEGGVQIIIGVFWGIVDGIVDAATWLWDVLVGNSIIPDTINAIIKWFEKLGDLAQWVWDNLIKPVYDFFVDGYNDVIDQVKGWWGGIKDAWKSIKDGVKSWWKDNVWDPIKNGITDWWAGRIQVWSGWWDAIKDAWKNITNNVKTWWSNNIWEPITNGISSWWSNRLYVWGTWWEALKGAWNNITTNIRSWWSDNIWGPVSNGISTWWGNRVADFTGWWAAIKGAWSNLLGENGVGAWWSKNVTEPIKNKITGIWTEIENWFINNKNILKNAIKPIVNSVISAVNKIIGGLNKVADVLPGNLWEIAPIPEMDAAGTNALGMQTRRANRGFKTNGPRAIVGEGKANHPEFVIPTDPTYRNRAKSLLAMAAQKLGMDSAAANVRNSQQVDAHGIPQFSIGGWLSEAWDDTKNLGKKIANLPKQIVGKTLNKILDKAQDLVDKVGYQPIEAPAEMGISKLRSWVTDFDDNIAKKLDSMTPAGGDVPVANPSAPGALQWWNGGLFTRKMVASMEKAEELAGAGIRVMQGGFRPATSYSGTSHQGDALDMQVHYGLLRALRRVGIASGDRTGLGDWDPHIHAVPGPDAGSGAGSAVWQWQDYLARGGASQSPTSPWGLKYGGIVKKRLGGVKVTMGEGDRDEAVIPLPRGWRPGGGGGAFAGGTTNHFHGDLVFPNIKSGDDAELFIQNLENVARD